MTLRFDLSTDSSRTVMKHIDKDSHRSAKIRVGPRFHVIAKGGQITLVPDRPIASMRGFVRGMKTTGFREKKDRF